MVVKWDLPLSPPPSWLDPAAEITEENDNKPKKWKDLDKKSLMAVFVKACFIALKKLGLNTEQALEVLSNSVVETGWGKSFRAWNLGGWKIKKTDAEAAKAKGKVAKWWRAPGNKSSGDPPTCFYRGFDSLEEFFEEWIEKFIPKPGTVGDKHRYKKTGEAFWSNSDWFYQLCKAGYKGSITAANPQPSVDSHKLIVEKCIILLCQDGLKVKADGDWGPKSTEACKKFQKEHNLEETGKPSIELLEKLFQ